MNAAERGTRQNFITAAWVEWRRRCTNVPPFAEQLTMLRTIGHLYHGPDVESGRLTVPEAVDWAISRTMPRAA